MSIKILKVIPVLLGDLYNNNRVLSNLICVEMQIASLKVQKSNPLTLNLVFKGYNVNTQLLKGSG